MRKFIQKAISVIGFSSAATFLLAVGVDSKYWIIAGCCALVGLMFAWASTMESIADYDVEDESGISPDEHMGAIK